MSQWNRKGRENQKSVTSGNWRFVPALDLTSKTDLPNPARPPITGKLPWNLKT
jgi:hypothetical protein